MLCFSTTPLHLMNAVANPIYFIQISYIPDFCKIPREFYALNNYNNRVLRSVEMLQDSFSVCVHTGKKVFVGVLRELLC